MMIQVKKYILANLFFAVFLFCVGNTYGQYHPPKKDSIVPIVTSVLEAEGGDIFDTILLPRVVLNDSVLKYLIYEVLQKETNCPYYVDSYSISIDMVLTTDNKYRIMISLWDTDLLAWTGPSAFFTIDNHIGFLFGNKNVLDSSTLFCEVGCNTQFICNRSALYRNLITDDSRSEYYYWLIDKKWYYGTVKYCGEFGY